MYVYKVEKDLQNSPIDCLTVVTVRALELQQIKFESDSQLVGDIPLLKSDIADLQFVRRSHWPLSPEFKTQLSPESREIVRLHDEESFTKLTY